MTISERRKKSPISAGLSISSAVYLIVASVVFIMGVGGCGLIPLFATVQKTRARITKGPVLLRVYQDRAAVMWETNTQGSGRLYYGQDKKPDEYVESIGQKVQYEAKDDDEGTVKKTAFVHKVWLEDLEPGRLYNYCVSYPDCRGRAKPIAPALWLDYHYEIGRVKETVSKPIMAKAKRD